jgi:hypothetical protein
VFVKTITALCATALLAMPTAASANLGAAGPVDPASVPFPTFYDDGAGTSLALCVNDPLCPASPPVFTNEAPNDEAFYMAASAELSGPQGQSVAMEFAIEAAWLDPETPITFGRIQATLKGLEPNSTYTVEHPWGVSHFTTEPDGTLVGGKRAAQREETDGTFADTLSTPIGPFIRNVNAPAGYLGNGLTAGPVTGSLIRNSIRVTGPGLPQEVLSEPDPITGEQTILQAAGITTDQFTVEGKLFDPNAPLPPVLVPKEPDRQRRSLHQPARSRQQRWLPAAGHRHAAASAAHRDREAAGHHREAHRHRPAGPRARCSGPGCPAPSCAHRARARVWTAHPAWRPQWHRARQRRPRAHRRPQGQQGRQAGHAARPGQQGRQAAAGEASRPLPRHGPGRERGWHTRGVRTRHLAVLPDPVGLTA